MRLRHIKGAEEEIAESPYVVQDPQSLKGKWNEFFGNNNPIRIEVGMGKGKFIMELAEVFDEGEVDRIYLNFSDPWPKDRHAKRRLTSDRFLPIYDKIMKNDGIIEFKTDNQGLFEYSLESIPEAGWNVDAVTFDLHNSYMNEGNVMTEYETKFSAEGKPICKLIASREKKEA